MPFLFSPSCGPALCLIHRFDFDKALWKRPPLQRRSIHDLPIQQKATGWASLERGGGGEDGENRWRLRESH